MISKTFRFLCGIFLALSLFMFLWPFPLFIIPEQWLLEHIFNNDKSAASGLPLLWAFVTLPIGAILFATSFACFALSNYFEKS